PGTAPLSRRASWPGVPARCRPPPGSRASPPSSPFFFSCPGAHRDLPSFPTRRSSDLIEREIELWLALRVQQPRFRRGDDALQRLDRKSTRLNSSHVKISYAVFCLKKKKHDRKQRPPPSRPTRCLRDRSPPLTRVDPRR